MPRISDFKREAETPQAISNTPVFKPSSCERRIEGLVERLPLIVTPKPSAPLIFTKRCDLLPPAPPPESPLTGPVIFPRSRASL